MRSRLPALTLIIPAIGLAACGDDGNGKTASSAKTPTGGSAARSDGGRPVLIKTRIVFVRGGTPRGKVLPGSQIGGQPFCPGGTLRDKQGSASIGFVGRSLRCPDGRLTIGFDPQQPGKDGSQRGPWRIVNGTGRYKGLRASGAMRVVYEKGDQDIGRETFTGKTR